MWRRTTAVLLIFFSFLSMANTAYSFGYLGIGGFASQQSVQQLIISDLKEQISRVTIRWCVARQMRNREAFDFATAELGRLIDQYKLASGGLRYQPTCNELLIDG